MLLCASRRDVNVQNNSKLNAFKKFVGTISIENCRNVWFTDFELSVNLFTANDYFKLSSNNKNQILSNIFIVS